MAKLTTIYWRDIPAQVIGQQGSWVGSENHFPENFPGTRDLAWGNGSLTPFGMWGNGSLTPFGIKRYRNGRHCNQFSQ